MQPHETEPPHQAGTSADPNTDKAGLAREPDAPAAPSDSSGRDASARDTGAYAATAHQHSAPDSPARSEWSRDSSGQHSWGRYAAPWTHSSAADQPGSNPAAPYPAPPQPQLPYPQLPYPSHGAAPYGGVPMPPAIPPRHQPRGLSPFGRPARHPWEIPLLCIVIVSTSLAFLIAIAAFIQLIVERALPNIGVLLLVFAPIVLWAARGINYAAQRVSGVRMSPTQFPEGYRMVAEAAARFGLTKPPDAYVILGNGQINAFASGHGFRRFVVVYSDLFEIGGAAREPDALAFIIGHEVGHIAAGHTSYWRQLGMFVVPYLPIIGSSLIRSQEYTADNHGFCNRPQGAAAAMGTLAAGKYLNTLVGFDEMADRAAIEKGFFVWTVNAMSTHPVLTWRMSALRDRSRHGRVFWRPSRPAAAPVGGYPSSYGEVPALPPKPTP